MVMTSRGLVTQMWMASLLYRTTSVKISSAMTQLSWSISMRSVLTLAEPAE